ARSPAPAIAVAVGDRGRSRAAGCPRPAGLATAVPVAPERGVVTEAVIAVRADPRELADGLAAEPQSVLQPVLLARQLDQVDPADGRPVQGNAIRRCVPPCVDHEAGVR